MASTISETKSAAFYREWLMGRAAWDPKDFGVEVDRELFVDQMVEDFNNTYRAMWTIDELLLHPREAIRFCDDFRRGHQCMDLPDDIILRSILGRRKRPGG